MKEDGRPVFGMPNGVGVWRGYEWVMRRDDERSLKEERGSSFQGLIKEWGVSRHILSFRWWNWLFRWVHGVTNFRREICCSRGCWWRNNQDHQLAENLLGYPNSFLSPHNILTSLAGDSRYAWLYRPSYMLQNFSPDICVKRKSIPDLMQSFNSGCLWVFFTRSEWDAKFFDQDIHSANWCLCIEFEEHKSFSLSVSILKLLGLYAAGWLHFKFWIVIGTVI